jgi:hypothetical protein
MSEPSKPLRTPRCAGPVGALRATVRTNKAEPAAGLEVVRSLP